MSSPAASDSVPDRLPDSTDEESQQRLIRPGLIAQKGRALAYTGAFVIALVSAALGLIEARLSEMVAILATAYCSIALFTLLYRTQGAYRWRIRLALGWLLVDCGLITWSVHLSGGADSPWLPWYIANISGAAFALGELGVLLIALVDVGAYLGMLVATGEISGLSLEALHHLFAMLVLIGASMFLLYGVTVLKRRRLIIHRMRSSEHRKIEELKHLAAELDARTRDLEAVNTELREATRLKSQFLANMSHELRTPLNSIIGFSEILQRRLSSELDAKHARFLGNIHASGEQLLEMINDILDLAKIEVGRLELQPADLIAGKVVLGVIKIVNGGGEHKGVEIVPDIEDDALRLEADPSRVKQVLFHLLSNAVKFSPEGSTVQVQVRRLPEDRSPLACDAIQFTVVDQGIGIDARDQQVIFEEFRQVDGSSTRQYEGAGLGLALVKRFVELHNGTVTVRSVLGRGSTFVVTLPIRFRGYRRAFQEQGGSELQDLQASCQRFAADSTPGGAQ